MTHALSLYTLFVRFGKATSAISLRFTIAFIGRAPFPSTLLVLVTVPPRSESLPFRLRFRPEDHPVLGRDSGPVRAARLVIDPAPPVADDLAGKLRR